MSASEFRRLFEAAPTAAELEEVAARIGAADLLHDFQVKMNCERVAMLEKYARVLNQWLVLGGGFVINYYVLADIGEPPRFTFDLDAAPPRRGTKAQWIAKVPQINSELLRRGVATSAELGGRVVYLGTLEHDVEKDALPYLLPLRAPVVARWSGVPLWKYLERLGIRLSYSDVVALKRLSREVLGVDTPRVDYVRVGVSVALEPPVEIYKGITVSSIRWQLAEKAVHKIIRPLEEGRVDHDVLKAVLDLRAVWAAGPPDLGRSEAARLAEALPQAAEAAAVYWNSHHYVLVRRKYQTPREVAERISAFIRESLADVG